ncbi:MAG: phosphopantetheine-binding protein [Pseudomonadota bacterium]
MSTGLEQAIALVSKATNVPADSVGVDAAVGALEAWDSVAHVHIMLALEERIGRDLTADEIADCMTVEAIASVLDAVTA